MECKGGLRIFGEPGCVHFLGYIYFVFTFIAYPDPSEVKAGIRGSILIAGVACSTSINRHRHVCCCYALHSARTSSRSLSTTMTSNNLALPELEERHHPQILNLYHSRYRVHPDVHFFIVCPSSFLVLTKHRPSSTYRDTKPSNR